ncbi:MAG: hypothetical protein KC620_23610, partial [Myxococcales bacterium]|nr:hypothetical protein [Myxococcales bacterium]
MNRWWLAGFVCLGLFACDDGAEADAPFVIDAGALDGAPDVAELPDVDIPDAAVDVAPADAAIDAAPNPPTDECAAAAGGPPDPRPLQVLLSEAHALYRYFGAHTALTDADLALVEAVRDGLDAETAARYAFQTGGCLLAADGRAARPTEVTLRDGVARVQPGAEPPDIPAEAEAVLIDLRGAPAEVLTEAHLAALAQAALSAPVPR